jgi:PAS domain S-box-containing protein
MPLNDESFEEFPSFSIDRYRILVEQADDIIYEADPLGFFTFVNSRAAEILGYSRSDFLTKKYTDLIRADFVVQATDFYKTQLASNTKTTYFEFPAVSANGSIIWLGQQLQLLYRGSELKGVMAVARVITEKYLANDALRQSEEKYRNIIQNLQFGLIEVDKDERITYINDAMCEISGYAREELMGIIASEVLTNEEMRVEIKKQNKLREKNQSSVYEAQILTKSGKAIYALISGAPTFDSKGTQIGSIGIHLDISDRKAKEIELFEGQQFLYLINQFVIKLLEEDTVNGITSEVASHIVTAFGFDNAKIYILNLDKNIFELKASLNTQHEVSEGGESWKFGEGIIGSVAKSGSVEIISNTALDPRYIVPKMPSGSELAVPIKAENQVIGIINCENKEIDFFNSKHVETLQIIANLSASRIKNAKTKRRQEIAENELRESEKKLRTVIKSALDAIITIDEWGKIQEWNPRAEEIFGWRSDEVIGKSLTENIIPTHHHQSHENGMKKFNSIGVGPALNQRLELTAMRKTKDEFPIELTIIPIVQGGIHSFTAFIRDITLAKSTRDEMEKSLAKERELNELKSRFVSMTSHEFRTPLTTIKQNVDLINFQLEMENPNSIEIYGKYFKRIDSEIGRVTNLMNDILLLGKIEAGKVEISKRQTDLVQLAELAIQKICQGRLDARMVKLELAGVPRFISIDPLLIEHVLTNVISNSLKYSPDAKDPILIISFNKLSEIIITCRDFGIGIPKKDQKGLFSSFYRATNVKNIQGSGLGLSITMEFLLLHKGTISVLSDTNKGSAFIITLPSE